MQKCKKNLNPRQRFRFFVAPIGFEPIQTEPESAVLPLHNRAKAKCAAKIQFFLYRASLYEKFFLADENHFIPDVPIHHNCLIINIIHFVVQGVVEDDFFVVAGEFCHAGADRRSYNLVIIVVWEVKSAIVVVVVDIVVDHNHRVPGVEESVGDDSSKGRAADHVVTIEVAAEDTIVEVVGSSVVVYRSDVVRDMHVSVVVVVVRVYVGSVRSRAGVRAVTVRMSARVSTVIASGLSARMSARTGLVTASVVAVASIAGTADRLRLCLSAFGVASSFCHCAGRGICTGGSC